MKVKVPPSSKTQIARTVPFEKDANFFESEETQSAAEEIDFRQVTLEPTGFDNIDDSTISFVNATRTFTITPVGASFIYRLWGKIRTKTSAENVVIGDVDGIWYIYYDDSTLTANQTEPARDGFLETVAIVHWNVSQAKAIWFGDDRSGFSMTWGTRRRTDAVTGAQTAQLDFLFQNFDINEDGSLDAHAQFGITGGDLHNHDLIFKILHSAAPANPYEQIIDSAAQIPIFYRTGAGVGIWAQEVADGFALLDDSPNLIQYNANGAGWSLQNAPENFFVATYLFATTDPRLGKSIIGILGDRASPSPLSAVNPLLTTPPGLSFSDFAFLGVIVFQTSVNFTNTPKARLALIKETDIIPEATDRYAILAQYNGNANTGRYLELSAGQSSDVQPLLVPEDSYIRTVTLQSTATIGIGKAIGFFEAGNLVTPRFTVIAPVGGLTEHIFNVTEFFLQGEKIVVQTTVGNISKPVVRFWIETVP